MTEAQNSQQNRILLVEDDENVRLVLELFLRFSGFEVECACNGQEAINSLPVFQPDLVVLDLVMEPVSGWDVLHWLQEHPVSPPLPVIVLSGLIHLPERLQGFEEGAVEYLTKPTQPSVLVTHIRELLSLSAEQRMDLQGRRIREDRLTLERIKAPQADEFLY